MKWNGNEYENWNDSVETENSTDKEHPTSEQLLLKLAIEDLTPKQRQIWDMYAYRQMTHEDIAAELGIKRQSIGEQIHGIERHIKKYCKHNKAAYILLKLQNKIMNGEK